MSANLLLLVSTLFAQPAPVSAPADTCAAVLRPNVEVFSQRYEVLQSYVYHYAAEEYDRLEHLDDESRALDVVYQAFRLEYNESKGRKDFEDRVRKVLKHEGFSSMDRGSLDLYRSYIGATQVDAWLKCRELQSDETRLLLVADTSNETIILRLAARPGRGVSEMTTTVTLTGGTINGNTQLSIDVNSITDLSYIVTRSNESAGPIAAVANGGGASDTLTISQSPAQSVLNCEPEAGQRWFMEEWGVNHPQFRNPHYWEIRGKTLQAIRHDGTSDPAATYPIISWSREEILVRRDYQDWHGTYKGTIDSRCRTITGSYTPDDGSELLRFEGKAIQ